MADAGSSDDATDRRWAAVPPVVATALVVAVVSNLAVLPIVELETVSVYRALEVRGGHDQITLVEEHVPSTREDFLFELRVGELTSDVTVLVSRDVPVTEEYLVGLGDADVVSRLETRLVLDGEAALALAPLVVAAGVDDTIGEYRIALRPAGDGPVEELVVLPGPDATWAVDRGLLDELGVAVGQ